METHISVTGYLNPTISRQVHVAKDELTSKQTKFDVSQKKVGNASAAAQTEPLTIQSLYQYPSSLFQETNTNAPSRQRYKRRNSAIASMLFPSVTTAAATSDSREPIHSLRLSTTLLPMDSSEALSKTKEILNRKLDSPPARREITVMPKRASATSCVPTGKREIEQSRKRRRTTEYAHS